MMESVGAWMKKYGKCVYGCDYAGWQKQNWGYYTKNEKDIYMVVFNVPYSGLLLVKTLKGVEIEKAILLNGDELKIIELGREAYHVKMPDDDPGEPFVIKLVVKEKKETVDKYRDALI